MQKVDVRTKDRIRGDRYGVESPHCKAVQELPDLPGETYDWEHALAYLGLPATEISYVIAASSGRNDELDWCAVLRLKDGRHAYVEAGCDYTGWGCQECGWHVITNTLDELIPQMSDDGRRRLGVSMMGDDDPEETDEESDSCASLDHSA